MVGYIHRLKHHFGLVDMSEGILLYVDKLRIGIDIDETYDYMQPFLVTHLLPVLDVDCL